MSSANPVNADVLKSADSGGFGRPAVRVRHSGDCRDHTGAQLYVSNHARELPPEILELLGRRARRAEGSAAWGLCAVLSFPPGLENSINVTLAQFIQFINKH
jgi:hypothetical protein